VNDALLLYVTPLPRSIETLGGAATPLIERNTTIPVKKSQVFSTAADSQTQVEIHVVQGERPMATDNKSLGKFILDGIPPAPRGIPQIEVTFDIDANGILNVSAQDKASGREQKITITASSGLSKPEVERMVKEAEAHASEDARRREEIELRNHTDALLYSTERSLTEHGAKLSEAERAAIEQALGEAREAVKGDDLERIRRAQENLTNASRTLSEAAYREARGGANGPQGPQGSGAPQDDVVDAEFRNVDDRKP